MLETLQPTSSGQPLNDFSPETIEPIMLVHENMDSLEGHQDSQVPPRPLFQPLRSIGGGYPFTNIHAMFVNGST